MLRFIGIVLLLAVIIAGVLAYRVMNAAGAFVEVKPHFAGTCKQVDGVVGAEDIELDRATGLIFISSQDRRPVDGVLKQGGIFLAHHNFDFLIISVFSLAVGGLNTYLLLDKEIAKAFK